MSTGWKKLSTDDYEGSGQENDAIEGLDEQRSVQSDGVFECDSTGGSVNMRTERRTISSTSVKGFEGALTGVATEPVASNEKVEMGSIGQSNVGINLRSSSDLNMSEAFYLERTLTPLTGPPRRRRPPIKVDWSTPKWGSSSGTYLDGGSKLRSRMLSEDFPPLSPQVSPKTLPSSPTETLNPSTTLWEPTLQVNLRPAMPTSTLLHPLPITSSPHHSSLEATGGYNKQSKHNKHHTLSGKFNPQSWRWRTPRRDSSMDFACRGSVARSSVFSEHVDPGFSRKGSIVRSSTWSPGNTIRITKKAVGWVFGSLSSWKERTQNESRAWKDASTFARTTGHVDSTQVTYPSNYVYPSPPPSPHPGNRVYISEINNIRPSVIVKLRTQHTTEVSGRTTAEDEAAVEEKLKKQRKRGRLQRFMTRDKYRDRDKSSLNHRE